MVQLHPVCVSQYPVELVACLLACLMVGVAALEFTAQSRMSLCQTHPFCYSVILHVYFMLKQFCALQNYNLPFLLFFSVVMQILLFVSECFFCQNKFIYCLIREQFSLSIFCWLFAVAGFIIFHYFIDRHPVGGSAVDDNWSKTILCGSCRRQLSCCCGQ